MMFSYSFRPAVWRRSISTVLLCVSLLASGCATLTGADAPVVKVVGLTPIASEGLEFRFDLKLRVLNPNDAPIDFDGISVALDLDSRGLAHGVSDAKGTVPRFGESVLSIPVTVSAFAALRQLLARVREPVASNKGGSTKKGIAYSLSGKLGRGGGFNALRFRSDGELDLDLAPAAK